MERGLQGRRFYTEAALHDEYVVLDNLTVIQVEDGTERYFRVFDHPTDLYREIPRNPNNTFKLTWHDRCMHGYPKVDFDLDFKGGLAVASREKALRACCTVILRVFNDMYSQRATENDLWVTDNHSRPGVTPIITSYHLYLQFVIHDDSRSYFYQRVRDSVPYEYRYAFDVGTVPQRHQLRGLRCSKVETGWGPKRYKVLRHSKSPRDVQDGDDFLRHNLHYMSDNTYSYEMYLVAQPLAVPGYETPVMSREAYNDMCDGRMFLAEYARASLTFNYHCPVVTMTIVPPKPRDDQRVPDEVLEEVKRGVISTGMFETAGFRPSRTKRNVIQLLRTRPSHCVVCCVVHKCDNAALVLSKDSIFFRCYRATRAVELERYLEGKFDGSLWSGSDGYKRSVPVIDGRFSVPKTEPIQVEKKARKL